VAIPNGEGKNTERKKEKTERKKGKSICQ
jgi:hypothetical protein